MLGVRGRSKLGSEVSAGSEGAVLLRSVTARVFHRQQYPYGGRGLSRTAIAAAAT